MEKPTANDIVSSIFKKFEGKYISMPELRVEVKKLSKGLDFQEPADPERNARAFYADGILQKNDASYYCYDSSKISPSLVQRFAQFQYLYDRLPEDFEPTAFIKIPIGKVPKNENAVDFISSEIEKYKSNYGTYGLHYAILKYALELSDKNVSNKELCEKSKIGDSYTSEISKMKSIFDIIKQRNEIDYSSDNKINNVQADSITEPKTQQASYVPNYFQTIFYGVPGSGKSHKIKEILQNELNISNIENQVVRTVFHPEYTNADFVGQILPNVKDGQVQYKFTPGPFSIILKKALLDSKNNYALIIEEINRGNAAAIFGELFQLLDRLEKNQKDEIGGNTYTAGWSEYFVMNSAVNEFVRDAVGEDEKATKALDLFDGSIHFSSNTGIRLPPNLSIFATMNTSDQNVFKLDNAFKRRWDLILIQNEFGETDDEIHQRDAQVEGFDFTWEQFRKAANKIITEENDTDSFSDKQLGCWFAKAERISDEEKQFIIPRKLFADKVLEYLWDDVFSFDEGIFFNIANYKTFADVAKSVEDKSKTIKIEDLFSKSFCDEIAKIKNLPGENPADSETSSKMTVAGE